MMKLDLVIFCENAQPFLSQNKNIGIIESLGMDAMKLLFAAAVWRSFLC